MKEKLKSVFSLQTDQASNDEIEERIKSGASVTGTNMYILILAILIASIGLNMNSTAVVIGAMLISPLMSVIMSIAYGIANQETPLLKSSIDRFLFQITISIVTSTLYFLISPLDGFSGELAARTNPTIWDVLIAVFGGFSAIIASTRKSMISNVIPGAAIATALMPPLCTVGYCIASARWLPAISAFYLFCINAVFICISSVIGLRMMHATKKKWLMKAPKTRRFLVALILVTIIPSGFLAWRSVTQYATTEQYQMFMQQAFNFDNTQVVKSSLDTDRKVIRVALIGSVLDEKTVGMLEQQLENYRLEGYTLDVTQTQIEQGISKEELDQILQHEQDKNVLVTDLEKEVENTRMLLELQTKAKELQTGVVHEIMLLYPNVTAAGFSDVYDAKQNRTFSLLLQVKEPLTAEQLTHLQAWLQTKFEDSVNIVQLPAAAQRTETVD